MKKMLSTRDTFTMRTTPIRSNMSDNETECCPQIYLKHAVFKTRRCLPPQVAGGSSLQGNKEETKEASMGPGR